ncbi:ArsR family transcriptional regulator [Candidatus Woesearchaeota archaeon]|nr:ArsR family transcriptional regulator [Candidatus Woesearchaeota archaeon]
MVLINKEVRTIKRTFIEIRNSILLSLASGQKTINQISGETQVNWKTVERHLVYLVGRGWAREAFSSAYVRVFELTAFGKDYLRKKVSKSVQISDDKIISINGDSRL